MHSAMHSKAAPKTHGIVFMKTSGSRRSRGDCTMKVKDVMTRGIETCTQDTDLAAAAMTMWRRDCGVVPVADAQGKLVGVITDRDICMAVATKHRPAEQVHVRELITGTLHAVRPEDDVKAALD